MLGCGLVGRTADANPHESVVYVPFVVVLFLLPGWYATGLGRAVWRRYATPLVGLQAAATYLPFALFGSAWVGGVSGLLGALSLLLMPRLAGWAVFLALGAVELALWLLVGLPYEPTPNAACWVLIAYAVTAISTFGLTRLADQVDTLQAARQRLVADAVASQRLAATERLQERVVARLAQLAARASEAVAATQTGDARAALADAGTLARRAAADSRRLLLDLPDPAPPVREGGPVVPPRLAQGVAATVVVLFAAQSVLNVVYAPSGSDWSTGTKTLAVLAAAVVGPLTLHQLALDGATHHRPRWVLVPVVQAAFALALYARTAATALPLLGLVAVSVAVVVGRRTRWLVLAVGVACLPVLTLARPPSDLDTLGEQLLWSLYATATQTAGALTVYGLARLAAGSRAVQRAQRELAAAAATEEQLRLARDVHDTLGLGLSTIALKSDLALELWGMDQPRARREAVQLMHLATSVGADARSVGGAAIALDLEAELRNARAVLSATGAEVDVEVPPGADLASATTAATALATVLREAVTNVLRHSRPRRCGLRLQHQRDALVLHLENDGSVEPNLSPGVGLQNMRDRLRPLGGQLSTQRDGDTFTLTASVPTRVPTAVPA